MDALLLSFSAVIAWRVISWRCVALFCSACRLFRYHLPIPPIMVVMVSLLYLALIKRSQASRSPSIWQGRQDLNLRHPVLETGALPTELLPYADG